MLLPGQRQHLQPEPHQRGKGAIGLQHYACAVERDHARGNGLDDRLQFAAALLDGAVGRGELRLSSSQPSFRLASRSAAM